VARFKVGDLVRLKSGGPPMTVSDVLIPAERGYSCTWFVGRHLKSSNFKEQELIRAVKETSPEKSKS
jgi:uncharacterized protein YodC (DUF2158 family)